jgi:hypothetical protein
MTKKIIFKIILFFAIFLLFSPKESYGQWVLQSGLIDEQIHRGMELTYNMEYATADRTFDSVIS